MVDSDDEYRQEMDKFMRKELAAIRVELMGNNEEKPTQPVPIPQITKIEPIIRSEPPDSVRQRIMQNIPPEIARQPSSPPQLPFNIQSRLFPPRFVSPPRFSPFVSPEISPEVSPSKAIRPTVSPPTVYQAVPTVAPPPTVSAPIVTASTVTRAASTVTRPAPTVTPAAFTVPTVAPPPTVTAPTLFPPTVFAPGPTVTPAAFTAHTVAPPPTVTPAAFTDPRMSHPTVAGPTLSPYKVFGPAPTVTPPAPPTVTPAAITVPTVAPPPTVAVPTLFPPTVFGPGHTVTPAAPTVTPPAPAPQQMPLMRPNKPEETPLKLREEVHFEFVHVPLIPTAANPPPPRQRSIPPPPVTVPQAQPRPTRSNADRIPLQHRPPQPRRTESPPVQTRQPPPVDFPLIESDTSIYHGNRGRNRPITPLFEPEPPVHQLEQSTWVDETLVESDHQMNPNEAIFLSDSSTDVIPDRMFPELCRDFRTQQEIQEEQRGRMNARFQTDFERRESTESWERPSTAMSTRRPPILPPPSKGRATNGILNQTIVSNAPAPHMGFERYRQNPHHDDFSFDEPNQPTSSNQISRRSQLVATTTESYNSQIDPNNFNPDSWTTEALEKMNEEQLKEIVNFFYESGPHLKFKESYPFLAEGMIQKDSQTNMLKVFSSRLGKILIQDTRIKKSEDYVYFVVIKAGDYRGFYYDTHPKCLISAKFPTVERIVLRGYAILAHPIGSREDSLKENRWICWNDSLGLMSIISGAARTPLKKQPVWDKQLDIISIHANFENKRFVVTQVVGLTNTGEKEKKFPEEVFLIRDGVYRRTHEDDIVFYSSSIKAEIVIKKTLVGEVDIYGHNPLDIVVVPYFPRSTALEFRALLIIHMPDMFWSRDKEWIRELLAERTKAYIR